MVADRRIYLDETETKLVEHGDPAAAYLLVGEGCEVHPNDVKKFGIREKNGVLTWGEAEEEVETEEVETENQDASKGASKKGK